MRWSEAEKQRHLLKVSCRSIDLDRRFVDRRQGFHTFASFPTSHGHFCSARTAHTTSCSRLRRSSDPRRRQVRAPDHRESPQLTESPTPRRVVGLDLERHAILIQDEGVGLVVQLAPINDEAAWAPKLKDLVMTAGDLCISDVSIFSAGRANGC